MEIGDWSGAGIPLGGLSTDALKGLGPPSFHTQGHCVGKETFEEFGGQREGAETVAVDPGQKLLKSKNRRPRRRPLGRPSRHDHSKPSEDHRRQHATQDRLRNHQFTRQLPNHPVEANEGSDHGHPDHRRRQKKPRTNRVWPIGVVPLLHERAEDRPLDGWEMGREAVGEFIRGGRADHARSAGPLAGRDREHPVEERFCCRRERAPVGRRHQQIKGVLRRAKPPCRRCLADADDSPHGTLHHQRHQVAVVGRIIDEGSHFRRPQL